MGEEKLNSDNGKRQNIDPIAGNISNPGDKPTIDNTKEEAGNFNESTSPEQPLSDTSDTPNNFDVKSLADKVTDINRLRYELDRLQLDFKARAYFENDVRPLIDTLFILSSASESFSITAKNLANINFGHSSKIKDSIDLAEEVNEISEDLIDVLRCKIHTMLKFSKYDCK